MWKKILSALLFAGLSFAAAAEEYQAGVHYIELPTAVRTADPAKVEVTEMFGYSCPHCYSLEPALDKWHDTLPADVDFKRVPVVFGRSWEPLARAYYVADLLGALDKTHQPTFEAIHKERKRFRGVDDLADFYAELGVDAAKFKKYYDSFATTTKLNQGDSKVRSYQVDGVPALVINGKYRITAGMAGSQEEMLKVAEYLIEKERPGLKVQ